MEEGHAVRAKHVIVQSLVRQFSEALERRAVASRVANDGSDADVLSSSSGSAAGSKSLEQTLLAFDEDEKSVLVTLHYLLPSSFLEALALLDRRAVELFVPRFEAADRAGAVMCRIRRLNESGYEHVRSRSWTCSCGVFFRDAMKINDIAEPLQLEAQLPDDGKGGLQGSVRDLFLVVGECVHVVAAYLALNTGDAFRGLVRRTEITTKEAWLARLGVGR